MDTMRILINNQWMFEVEPRQQYLELIEKFIEGKIDSPEFCIVLEKRVD
jgi:hypothetical protein